jgi:hypothetical protein
MKGMKEIAKKDMAELIMRQLLVAVGLVRASVLVEMIMETACFARRSRCPLDHRPENHSRSHPSFSSPSSL